MDVIKLAIADDNPDFCKALQDTIGKDECISIIWTAKNGNEAVSYLQRQAPDVLLLDNVMPYKDGLQVLEEIPGMGLKRRPGVIMLTAIGHEALTKRAIALGADYYIVKPFDEDILLKRIYNLAEYMKGGYKKDSESSKVCVYDSAAHASSLEIEITDLLRGLSVPVHISGYRYLRHAVGLCVQDASLIGAITKSLYPVVAQKYSTTPEKVERAIRHAIEAAWLRGMSSSISEILGYDTAVRQTRPTNAECIALLTERIRMNHKTI